MSSSNRPGRTGSCAVVDVLGEGGMGVVYLVEAFQGPGRTRPVEPRATLRRLAEPLLWSRGAAIARLGLASIFTRTGRTISSLPLLGESRRLLEDLVHTDSTGFGWRGDPGAADTELARALLESGHWQKALEVAEAARSLLALEPATTVTHERRQGENEPALGHAFAAAGRGSEAQRAWLRALEITEQLVAGPGGAEFRPLLAEVLLALGRTEEAAPVLMELWERGCAEPCLSRLAAESEIVVRASAGHADGLAELKCRVGN